MIIAILTKEYPYSDGTKTGGTGIFYKTLAEGLAREGHEVYILTVGKNKLEIQQNGVQIKVIAQYFKRFKVSELFRSLAGKISFLNSYQVNFYRMEAKYLAFSLRSYLEEREIQPDIVETHDWDGVSMCLAELNIPYVIRFHGSWNVLSTMFGYKNVPVGRIECEKEAAKKSKNNIVISKYSERINEEIFKIQKPKLIYNGIDENFFKKNSETAVIPKSIFYLGNLSYEKGADDAFEIFRKVRKSERTASLHFIGTINDYAQKALHFFNEDELANVHFYGRKSGREIVELISKAEVVIFPSKGETFGLTIVETMALEKPVICSNLDVFKEIISEGKSGLIAISDEEFTSKIIDLFHNKTLALELGKNARKTVIEKFSLKQMINKTLDYYKIIVANQE